MIEASAGIPCEGATPRLSWSLKVDDTGHVSLKLGGHAGIVDPLTPSSVSPLAVERIVELARTNRFWDLDAEYFSLPDDDIQVEVEGRWVGIQRACDHSIGRRLILTIGTQTKSIILDSLAYDEEEQKHLTDARREEIRRFMRVWDAVEGLIDRDDILRCASSDAEFGA
jgi:hypothetical protein